MHVGWAGVMEKVCYSAVQSHCTQYVGTEGVCTYIYIYIYLPGKGGQNWTRDQQRRVCTSIV